MDERIKDQLIKKAGFHVRPGVENTIPGIDWNCGAWGYDQCVDRLIELVVEECANLCYNESIVEGEYFARILLRHFNVNGVIDQK